MKPVKKTRSNCKYSPHGTAKPRLLRELGEHCSYCERSGVAQDLHVEHIYPQNAHRSRATQWNNFLLACNTCNNYKRQQLGDGQQRSLFKRYFWPHLDNTFNAFQYKSDGSIEVAASVPVNLRRTAESTRDMVGLLRSPAISSNYAKLGIAYDGASQRTQIWSQALDVKNKFLLGQESILADCASRIGHFSIWMQVFHDNPVMRRELIRAFKADPNCFDPATTSPLKKGRL